MTVKTLTYAKDMHTWSHLVCIRGKCTFPGCSSKFGLGGHHIIRRAEQDMRLLVENGVCLCTMHHEQVEAMKGRVQYDKTMAGLVGKKRYEMLLRMNELAEKKRTVREHVEMPTSEIDF